MKNKVYNVEVDNWIRPWHVEKFNNLKQRDERFFSILVKGFLQFLNRNILMYNKPIKHFIFNTGSSYMYVESNGYEFSWNETTGEDYMYMALPRCVCEINDISVPEEELTNPYVRGNYERYTKDGSIKRFNAQIRRLPIEMTFTLHYVLGNFNETIILVQELFDQLIFQKFFNIIYLGQQIECSIEFPNSVTNQINKIDLATAEDGHRTIDISIKVCTNYPIINVHSEIVGTKIIRGYGEQIYTDVDMGSPNETTTDKINKNYE